jgi:hypothetical protein
LFDNPAKALDVYLKGDLFQEKAASIKLEQDSNQLKKNLRS